EHRRQLRAAEESEAAQRLQSMRFAAAVNNMPHGLSMFDADERLVICNDNYAGIYGLPPELTAPGSRHSDIAAYRKAHGPEPAKGEGNYLADREAIIARREAAVDTVEYRDGRVLSTHFHPMPDGGWVATLEDITERIKQMRQLQEREDALATQNVRFEAAV